MRFDARKILSLLLSLSILTGCAAPSNDVEQLEIPEYGQVEVIDEEVPLDGYVDSVKVDVKDTSKEAELIESSGAAISTVLKPKASGKNVKKNQKATIDYSNTKDGYVMVKYTGNSNKKIKVQIKNKITYTYNLPKNKWTALPLTDGNGTYSIKVYENVTGTKYALATSLDTKVSLKDQFAPFIRPNQYVDYSASSKAVAKAAELTKGIKDPLKKVEVVYNYVIKNISYDSKKAASVKSGYLPVLDNVMKEKKGICFDYASLMTGMLRSQGVPCKMIFGYAGSAYHAWISVWTESSGWVDGAIFFNGTSWQRMDPTFASSGNQSSSIMSYIGNGKNYTAKYLY